MSLTSSSPHTIAESASLSSRSLATLNDSARNEALTAIHDALASAKDEILTANLEDLKLANAASERGELSQSVLKRLDLGRVGKYEDMLKGILDVRGLDDPRMFFITLVPYTRLDVVFAFVYLPFPARLVPSLLDFCHYDPHLCPYFPRLLPLDRRTRAFPMTSIRADPIVRIRSWRSPRLTSSQ